MQLNLRFLVRHSEVSNDPGVSHVFSVNERATVNQASGLWTALILFVPLGTLALLENVRGSGVVRIHHAVGIAVAIGIHAAIVVYTRGKAAKMLKERA